MTQYPGDPYQPPQPYQLPYGQPYGVGQAPDALSPARRASLLMFILGGLTLLGSLCCGLVGAMIPNLIAEQPEIMQDIQLPVEVTPNVLQIVMIVLAALIFLYGVLTLVLANFVRRGSKGATITAMILAVLVILYLTLNAVTAAVTQGPRAAGGLCAIVIPAAIHILLLVWLVQALKSIPAFRAAQDYQARYWDYVRQYQAWQQQQQMQQGAQPPPPPGQSPIQPPIQTPPMPPPPTFGPPGDRGGGTDQEPRP